MIDEGGHAFKFGTVGCMSKYLAEHPGEHYLGLFVSDHSTGKFIEAADATFVRVPVSKVSIEKEYFAFRHADDAEALAKQEGGSTVKWEAVLAAATTP
jgi:hypothetical protein